jgi:DNA-binding transcriptional LysR family regulator
MVDMVEGGFDLALRTGPLPDSSLRTRRLGMGHMVLCAAPSYVARRGRPVSPANLAHHNCLTYTNSHREGHWRFSCDGKEQTVEVSGNLRSNSIEALRAATLSGLGICLLPLVNVSEDLKSGALVRLLPDICMNEVLVQAVYPPGRHHSVKFRTFLDFVVRRLCEAPVTALPDARPAIEEPQRVAS